MIRDVPYSNGGMVARRRRDIRSIQVIKEKKSAQPGKPGSENAKKRWQLVYVSAFIFSIMKCLCFFRVPSK